MNIDRLEDLCNTFGVSSAELFISNKIEDYVKGLNYKKKSDNLGSLIFIKQSKNKKAKTLMISSALDEIGFMVSNKNEDNVNFIPLEDINISSLINQRVSLLNREDKLFEGVITNGLNNLQNKKDENSINNLICYFNDIHKVEIGDLISFSPNFYFGDSNIISKALFPRVLNEIMITLMESLNEIDFDYNIAFSFTSQSIIGYRGTKTSTYVIKPDIAIALSLFDGFHKNVTLGCKKCKTQKSRIKNVPYIGNMGNDGSFIHKTLKGCPSLSVGIACLNIGSSNEICSLYDIEELINSLEKYLKNVNSKKIEELGFIYG